MPFGTPQQPFYVMRVLVADILPWLALGWRIVGKQWVNSLRTYDVLLRLDSKVLVTP